jgi:hypothetical protein
VLKVSKDVQSWLESPPARQAASASGLAASAAKGVLDAGGNWLQKQFNSTVPESKGDSGGTGSLSERPGLAADVSRAVGEALQPVSRLAGAAVSAVTNRNGDQGIRLSEIEEGVQTVLSYRPGCSVVSFVADSAASVYREGQDAISYSDSGVSGGPMVSKAAMAKHGKDMEVALLLLEAVRSRVLGARAALDPQLYEVLQEYFEVCHPRASMLHVPRPPPIRLRL